MLKYLSRWCLFPWRDSLISDEFVFGMWILFTQCIMWTQYRSTPSVDTHISAPRATQGIQYDIFNKGTKIEITQRFVLPIFFTCVGACTISNIFCGWQCLDHWMHLRALAGHGCRDPRSIFNAYRWIRAHTGNISVEFSLH